MKLAQLSMTVSRTFNLGNFESLRVEAGAVGEPEDGEDTASLRARLLEEVRESLSAEHRTFKPKDEEVP